MWCALCGTTAKLATVPMFPIPYIFQNTAQIQGGTEPQPPRSQT